MCESGSAKAVPRAKRIAGKTGSPELLACLAWRTTAMGRRLALRLRSYDNRCTHCRLFGTAQKSAGQVRKYCSPFRRGPKMV
jgi:hypothetical protein